MTPYEELLSKAEKLGIKIREHDFGADNECGYYCDNKILINSRITENQKHGVLAEEIGHHFKTLGDITDQTETLNIKQERIARRKGYEFLLQPIDLIYAYRCGCKDLYEISDFFSITIDKLTEIINDFKLQYGLGKKFDKYFIIFEPTLGFYEILNENYIY
ncbi:ImmA/IrrE family metallo-endopeptidase [Clostridium butyricum]|uniref:Phage protein n=1 Tax=Clostridium butyricum E4 str. BoNT E BL5262 TaxID=632245 RepID=C4IHJ2_CLOBU|nr:ImmA/IrrE family metallo-endopeptidase [Clostridium butyricum]EEP53962.1 phage protein [Clostridium butyricum E4 str. BoNT E BL5262]NFL30587.1 ImmA/IrrE family metallo-endopeptidase [Clostridium butyricum]NFS19541.1 ImmA/IrrE family metallo-endopeptidase [Clostridium butyricum]